MDFWVICGYAFIISLRRYFPLIGGLVFSEISLELFVSMGHHHHHRSVQIGYLSYLIEKSIAF